MLGIIVFIVSLLYLLLIFVFVNGWKNIPDKTNTLLHKNDSIALSVIVPYRNEADNLPHLLQALKHQTFQNFELVLVDDHSTDNSAEIIKAYEHDFGKLITLKSDKEGKKNALTEGILASSGNLIVSTDADCLPVERWLERIVSFQSENDADLIIGAVNMNAGNTVFQRLQQLEFVSLIASGAGAAGAKMPIMCNGANLVFKKNVWLKNKDKLHNELISGDDVFLLHQIKKQKGKILFLKSQNAIVYTNAVPSLRAFFKQRRRWASKSTSYSDWQTILVALVVFCFSFLQFLFFVVSLFLPTYWLVFLFLFLFKWALDYRFLSTVKDFFHLETLASTTFVLSLLYPFYIVITAVFSFFPQKKWN